MMAKWNLAAVAVAVFRLSAGNCAFSQGDFIPVYTYRVVTSYPHDGNAFTQGLAFERGVFYESTGLPGQSTLRKVNLEGGEVLRSHKLQAELFGEGVAVYGNRVIQLTWQSHTGFVYDKDTFSLLRKFSYPTEGWGITCDGKRLIMSDGTSVLHVLDPETLTEVGQINVSDGIASVTGLNELEYVRGEIYANIWPTDRIARISLESGKVVAWVDMKGLLKPEDCGGRVDVLNGIAYDPGNDRLFVTGKLWPRIFEIKLVPSN